MNDTNEKHNEPDLRRARFVVAYHGASFRGFASNSDVRTVLGELTQAIGAIVRHPVHMVGSGRTDAGVHGWGQVISADLPDDTDLGGLQHRVNRWLGPDIAMRSAVWANDGFDARLDATSRTYRYHVWNDPVPHPLMASTVWHVHQPLNLEAMNVAAAQMVGEHDFGSFCRKQTLADGATPASLVRIVYQSHWHQVERQLLRYVVQASSFCQQMVRSMVGTLVAVGYGRISADEIGDILVANDRSRAGIVAPPEGLVLWDVGYDGTRWDDPNRTEPPKP